MAKVSVYAELIKTLALAEFVPGGTETYPEFAFRTCEGIGGLDDNAYGKLSKPVQEWFSGATDALNAGKKDDIPVMSGLPEGETTVQGAAGAETETEPKKPVVNTKAGSKKAAEEPKPTTQEPTIEKEQTVAKKKAAAGAKKPVKKAAAKQPAAKKPTKAKTNGNGAAREMSTDSLAYKIRRAVIKNPEISFEDTCKQAGTKVGKPGGYEFFRWNEARQVMRVAKAEKVIR